MKRDEEGMDEEQKGGQLREGRNERKKGIGRKGRKK